MESIVVELVVGPEKNQDKTGHPYGKTGDIDEEISLVPSDIPESGLDVIS
jgi:hypothetical protein